MQVRNTADFLFQFTPLREGRLDKSFMLSLTRSFQFTPLREGRLEGRQWPSAADAYFNSRPSARGDQMVCAVHPLLPYFNSRPSARGDHRICPWLAKKLISIHAPPRGATRLSRVRPKTTVHFNSRPSARGDQRRTLGLHLALLFQFTPLREGRQARPARSRSADNFNSRPSARGDRKRYAISANLLFNPYKSAWLNNRATQFVEIILVIFHRIIV